MSIGKSNKLYEIMCSRQKMDYLDPNKKRAHKIRIMVGYGLFAVAISMATLILVYMANGYYVDRSTGEVIQNGLVFVDSKPGGSDVYLNGEKQNGKTDLRLVIPAGTHSVDIKREGYRDWRRTFQLDGGSLRRLTYARLFPNQLETANELSLRADVVDGSQSINNRWVVLSHAQDPLTLSVIDTEQPVAVLQALTIPKTIVANPDAGTLEFVEWIDNDTGFLAKYTVSGVVSFLLVNRENPDQSQNLNTLFGDSSLEIRLRDRKADQFFVYNPTTKFLHTATTSAGLSTDPLIKDVIAYKAFASDWVVYITPSDKKGYVDAHFLRGDKDIMLKQLQEDSGYLLQIAKLGNAPVMAISSPIENRAVVYNDPQAYLNANHDAHIPVATTVLRVNNPLGLSISADSSVVLAYGLDNFASHEFEADRSYNFKVDLPIDVVQKPRWMDGQHISLSSNGVQHVIDFDGSNLNELTVSAPSAGSFYSDNFNFMYSVKQSVPATDVNPAVSAIFTSTHLLTANDR